MGPEHMRGAPTRPSLSPGVTRFPAASFSYGSSPDPRHPAGPAHGRLDLTRSRLAAQDRNGSGPLNAALKERSGKPIMDWLAKKLGGGARKGPMGRGENSAHSRTAQSHHRAAGHTSSDRWRNSTHVPPPSNGMKLGPRPSSSHHRLSGPPARHEPLDLAHRPPRSGMAPTFRTRSSASPMSSPAVSRSSSGISLAASFLGVEDPDDRSFVPSFRTHGTDDGASLRPIAPSHSSSPARSGFHSHSASAHTPPGHPVKRPAHWRCSSGSTVASSTRAPSEGGWRSFRSNGAHTTGSGAPSTKPTTVFSTDSGGAGGAGAMAHIAQDVPHPHPEPAQATGPHALPRPPSVYRTLTWESGFSGPSHPSPLAITSTPQDDLHDAPRTPVGPSSAQVPPPLASPIQHLRHSLVQAPKHSRHHPRGNPRPDAQPGPNASTLTLASSTFAFSPAPALGGTGRARSIADSMAAAAHPEADDAGEADSRIPALGDRVSGIVVDAAPPELRFETGSASPSSPQRDSPARLRPDGVGTLPTFDAASVRDHAASSARGGASASAYSAYSKHRALDDDASIRALRRRGSGESGTSKFSWAAGHAPWASDGQGGGVTLGQPVAQMAL